MKKAVLIAALVIGGLAMVWAVNVKKTPDNIPTEVEASAAEQAELKQAFDAIAEAYDKNRTGTLERFFGLTRKEREAIRCMEGQDPVKSSLELLREHGRKLSVTDVKYIAVEHVPSRFYITGRLNGEQPVRFVLNKQSKGYRLVGIAKYDPADKKRLFPEGRRTGPPYPRLLPFFVFSRISKFFSKKICFFQLSLS